MLFSAKDPLATRHGRIVVLIILLIVSVMQCGIAQTTTNNIPGQVPENAIRGQAYQLPFASTGNSIELTVANTAKIPLAGVTVTATDVPAWLRFVETEQRIALLNARSGGFFVGGG